MYIPIYIYIYIYMHTYHTRTHTLSHLLSFLFVCSWVRESCTANLTSFVSFFQRFTQLCQGLLLYRVWVDAHRFGRPVDAPVHRAVSSRKIIVALKRSSSNSAVALHHGAHCERTQQHCAHRRKNRACTRHPALCVSLTHCHIPRGGSHHRPFRDTKSGKAERQRKGERKGEREGMETHQRDPSTVACLDFIFLNSPMAVAGLALGAFGKNPLPCATHVCT